MSKRQLFAVFASIAALGVSLVVASPAAYAAGSITPWQNSVAVGGSFSASSNGCPRTETDGNEGYVFQQGEIRLLVGAGASQRIAAFGTSAGGVRHNFVVPGWVDPNEPAQLVGACIRTSYSYEDDQPLREVLFTLPAVSIDITPGSPTMTGPVISLSRPSAATGQSLEVTVSGCQGAQYASVVLLSGSDMTLAEPIYLAGNGGSVTGGSSVVTLSLARPVFEGSDQLPEITQGDHLVIGSCYQDDDEDSFQIISAPVAFEVSGTTPWDSITYEQHEDHIAVSGAGCDGGRNVTVEYREDFYAEETLSQKSLAIAAGSRDLARAARASARDLGEGSITFEVTPEPDGTWSAEVPIGEDVGGLSIAPSCGDPLADGFAYGPRSFYLGSGYADVYMERISPTSSPVGGQISVHLQGECEEGAKVGLYRDGELLSESAAVTPSWSLGVKASLAAPAQPGNYELISSCGSDPGDRRTYEVFSPTQVSGEHPLEAEPTDGWPSQGEREVYHGKIGPITLPPMEHETMSMNSATAAAKAMGPSGLFIDVPRPDGNFAITQMDINLVDDEGMEMPATAAHLHHFVINNKSKKNPACPGGSTFGLPGEIVGASGAEKTALKLDDPYGVMVKDSDDWTGVYELMSRSMETREVYITYDITYRRDVQNVRPVTRYFGSATGCSSFTWTVNGSGQPDTQSTYIKIQKPGRLIAGGAHVHNGASHADIVNDRGRRLCRSEIQYGDHEVGHGMGHSMRGLRADAATTTIVGEPITDDEYPPEFYDDDLEIKSISACGLAEQVSAGERIRFDAVYQNDRSRSGVMGIYSLFVWEGGGPVTPGPRGAEPIRGNPNYTG